MLKIKKSNPQIMYFDNDDDFYNFCVNPKLFARELSVTNNGEKLYSYDFDYTDAYKNALSDNKLFVIKDEDSQIYKHKAVSYRTITKPVKNLEQYLGEFDYGN